jgi:hypothetical protein
MIVSQILRLGVVAIALVPLAFASRRVRTGLLPDWSGAPAYLVETIIFLALLLGTSQLLGTASLFRPLPIVVGSVMIGVAVSLSCRWLPGGLVAASQPPTSASLPSRRAVLTALAIGMAIVALWTGGIGRSIHHGITDYDSLDYHLVFSGRFVSQGSTWSLPLTLPGSATRFYPANSELLHAFFMSLLGHDIVSTFLNVGWLALALLAGWCIGRPHKVAILTTAAVAVVVVTPVAVSNEAGSAQNDVAVLALFLSAVAILLQPAVRTTAVAVAGAAAGLGLGTKLTLLIPVAVLTVGVLAGSDARDWRRRLLAWGGPLLATGGYWYVRNLAILGNPVPPVRVGIGRFALPTTHFSRSRGAFTIAHYLTDSRVWHVSLLPGFRDGFGRAWPAAIGLALAGGAAAIVFGHRLLRVFGAGVFFTMVGYLVTPNSAGGPSGSAAFIVAGNMRYAFPAVALGLVLLPVALASVRIPLKHLLGLALFAVVAVGVQEHHLEIAVLLAVLVVSLGAASVTASAHASGRRHSSVWRTVAVAAILPMVAVTVLVERSYLRHRYVNAVQPSFVIDAEALNATFRWARNVAHARIAVGGILRQFPFYGLDLSNDVEYIGHHGPRGEFEQPIDCREWRRAIASGHFDYVVAGGERGRPTRMLAWARRDHALKPLLTVNSTTVYRVEGRSDPDDC